jgi:hypothetical protein
MAQVVVDGEGFIDQDPVRLQRFDECGKQGAIEIEEHNDYVILLLREFRTFIRRSFEIYRAGTEI